MRDAGSEPVARRRITVDDVRLHYRVAGRGRGVEGAPVICLAEPSGSSSSLQPLLRQMGEHRLAFALDLPGQGRSGNPPFGRRDPAWWLLAWLGRLGFEQAHLVVIGASIGVATDAIRRSRRSILSITSIAPPPLLRPATTQRLGHVLDGGVKRLPARAVASTSARLRGASAGSFREAMHPRDLQGEFEGLALPLLVVRGELDTVVLRDDAARLARLAHGTFIDLPGAGRDAHRTHPRPIANTMQRWWTSIEHPDMAVGYDASQIETDSQDGDPA